MPQTLTQQEIDERAAILRRFREALIRQRERFSRYLQMLEDGPAGDGMADEAEQIEIHVEIEKSIVREISSFEQFIEPLEMMYREKDPQGAAEIPELRAALERTRQEVVRRTKHNASLLKQQLQSLRSEISDLRVMRGRRSLYATPEPTTVDISA